MLHTTSTRYSGLLLAAALLPSTFAATYDVQVGPNGRLAYDPEYVMAAPGDMINFIFNPKNHTVTQSSFDAPCVPVPGGTSSGFMPVPPGTNPLPSWQVNVVDSNPAYFHCQQVNHCGQGMVFAINPPADPAPGSFSAFKAKALQSNGTPPTATTSTATDSYVTPPAPHWESATATVTWGASTWTTVYSSYDGTPPPTPAPQPVDHKVVVGENGQLSYNPASITAAVGDTVTFEFRPKNHTVTQSSFLKPCQRFVDPVTGALGFASGFQPVTADQTTFPTFTIKINDTAPIWGYCGQTNHCGAGMVFAINSVESGPNNFAAFKQLAQRTNGTAGTPSGSGSPAPSSSGQPNGAVGGKMWSGMSVIGGLAVVVAAWIS